jgi:hypothetical protein
MTILLGLLIFASGFLFGGIVMACLAAGAVGAMFSATSRWSSPSGWSPRLETSADPKNAPSERDTARRKSPTELRLVAQVGSRQPSPEDT